MLGMPWAGILGNTYEAQGGLGKKRGQRGQFNGKVQDVQVAQACPGSKYYSCIIKLLIGGPCWACPGRASWAMPLKPRAGWANRAMPKLLEWPRLGIVGIAQFAPPPLTPGHTSECPPTLPLGLVHKRPYFPPNAQCQVPGLGAGKLGPIEYVLGLCL